MFVRTGVPMAVREHACVGRDVEVPGNRFRQSRKRSRFGPGIERLDVAPGEPGPELGLCKGHSDLVLRASLRDAHIYSTVRLC